jgi:hypothetical protein
MVLCLLSYQTGQLLCYIDAVQSSAKEHQEMAQQLMRSALRLQRTAALHIMHCNGLKMLQSGLDVSHHALLAVVFTLIYSLHNTISSCNHACRQDRTFNVQFLKEEFDLGPEQIEALYQFAKFQFDCGNYSTASELLQVCSAALAQRQWHSGRGRGSSHGAVGAVAAAAAVCGVS